MRFQTRILFTLIVFAVMVAGATEYLIQSSSASPTSDVIDGNVTLTANNSASIFVHFHRTNNAGFLGYFSCKVGSQTFNMGGSATTPVYTINKSVSRNIFFNNQTLACTGSEYQAGKPFVTAQRTFSPYTAVKTPVTSYLMTGGVVRNTANNVHVLIDFKRSDSKGFLGFLNCSWGNQNIQKGGSTTTTDYYATADINASAYGNSTLKCTGSEYQNGQPVVALQKSFGLQGGAVSYKMDTKVNNASSTAALTVNFHRTDNVGFLGYLTCYANNSFQKGGSITTKNYIVAIPKPYYTTTYTCKGIDYRGPVAYPDITNKYTIPGTFVPTATPIQYTSPVVQNPTYGISIFDIGSGGTGIDTKVSYGVRLNFTGLTSFQGQVSCLAFSNSGSILGGNNSSNLIYKDLSPSGTVKTVNTLYYDIPQTENPGYISCYLNNSNSVAVATANLTE